jgi:hypothetical protein
MRAIEENNKLIAEFLGYTQPHPDYPGATYWYKKDESPLTLLSFDSDWNWLMKVVEKIESLNYNFNLTSKEATVLMNHSAIYQTLIHRIDGNNKKEAVYNTCVEFIKWYNGQKQY